MFYYDCTDLSERIDLSVTSTSKKCNICHCWYSLDKRFKFRPNICS